MNLTNPITITPPPITKSDGSVKTFNPIVLNELDLTIIDNAKRKVVSVQMRPIPGSLVLWENETYDSAGDYTQKDVENRVLQVLGNDPKSFIENLFLPPAH